MLHYITAKDMDIPQSQKNLEQELNTKFSSKLKALKPLAWKEYGLTFGVKAEDSFEVMKSLKEDFSFDMLIDVTCVDWLDDKENRFEVVYQLLSLEKKQRLCIKIEVPETEPKVASVVKLWPAANFLEREAWDMYGVEFEDHGDLRRILMYDEFKGHPLRKDYPILKKQPRLELRVPELHNTSKDMQRQQLVTLGKTLGKRNSGSSEKGSSN